MSSPPLIPKQAHPLIPGIQINGTQASQLLPQPQALPEGCTSIFSPNLFANSHGNHRRPPPYSTLPRLHTSATAALQRHAHFAPITPLPDCECGSVGFWGEYDQYQCEHEAVCYEEEDEDESWGFREVGYAMLYACIILALVLNMDIWMGRRRFGNDELRWSEVYGVRLLGDGEETPGMKAFSKGVFMANGVKIKLCLISSSSPVASRDSGDARSVSRIWRYIRPEDTGLTTCETDQVTVVASTANLQHFYSGDQLLFADDSQPDLKEIPGKLEVETGKGASDAQSENPDDLAEEGVLRQPLSVDENDGHLGGGLGGPAWRRRV